ncbi:TPA: hypothetical protein U0583_000493 [Streptococcus suis]|nr:hypothetical protein [Streptococcus suis]HEM2734029.1 hypothetical protein [Streptococcus suis]HEM4584335.1 hypothetical protein [Streptococcus suis]HEM5185847.1 hypothetical protein [Streptococcus suis]
MTENHYLEQAEKDRLELEQHRLNYMAGDTPVGYYPRTETERHAPLFVI